jgi:hypothetical protein
MKVNATYSEAVPQQVHQLPEKQETLVVVSVDVLWSSDGQLDDVPGSKFDFCLHFSVLSLTMSMITMKCVNWNKWLLSCPSHSSFIGRFRQVQLCPKSNRFQRLPLGGANHRVSRPSRDGADRRSLQRGLPVQRLLQQYLQLESEQHR